MTWTIYTYENISAILFKAIVFSESHYTSVASQNFINSLVLKGTALRYGFLAGKKFCTWTQTHGLNPHETHGFTCTHANHYP